MRSPQHDAWIGIFRREALDHRTRVRSESDLLMVPPTWARYTYRLLLFVTVTAVVLITLVSVPAYLEGPALVHRIDSGGLELVAFLPGQRRAELRPGLPVRVELSGYPYTYHEVTVSEIDEGLVLASRLADVFPLTSELALPAGSVAVIHASLPAETFLARGRRYEYFSGMLGVARVRVGSDRLLTLLLPRTRLLLEAPH